MCIRDRYLLSNDVILKKIDETISAGGTQVMIQGGLHPDLDFQYYLDMLNLIKKKYRITIHSFSPAEVIHLSLIHICVVERCGKEKYN